eukprot:CAMPEP_0194389772 /NCGR_PEP_ID=MMETSP0174-20130528/105889_1 /TAXON_ID=216777 /ORGANISM="Proboscia alata, Strain PI-D3" /LENGTH=73 /DNA_ID=CAMNT_0039182367 /DNA_START=473 /DNA_END=694 /DNA_ORIENTATION=-
MEEPAISTHLAPNAITVRNQIGLEDAEKARTTAKVPPIKKEDTAGLIRPILFTARMAIVSPIISDEALMVIAS